MNIVLIGFMGTGKSCLGKLLAERLGFSFLDTDQLIEARLGRPISEIFARDGEANFRCVESDLAREISGLDNTVIATGGGFVLNPGNIRMMRLNGIIISLTARPVVIYERVRDTSDRPLLAVTDPPAMIAELLAKRADFYQQADWVIDTSDDSPEDLAARIICELQRKGNLNETK